MVFGLMSSNTAPVRIVGSIASGLALSARSIIAECLACRGKLLILTQSWVGRKSIYVDIDLLLLIYLHFDRGQRSIDISGRT